MNKITPLPESVTELISNLHVYTLHITERDVYIERHSKIGENTVKS